jgi:predicted RNase H-like nuclease (RuvC/YqgF family)
MRPLFDCQIPKCGLPFLALVAGLLAVTITAYGQSSSDSPSLGDLARKQRQKQQQSKEAAKPKKIVTNEDIPEHPDTSSDWPASSSPSASEGAHDESSPPAGAVLQAGDQLKATILRQKTAVADLKSQIDKVQDSIHFVEANAYRNGVEYNKLQAQKQQEVQRLQSQLEEQKKNLEQMQETARKAGFGSAIWDP